MAQSTPIPTRAASTTTPLPSFSHTLTNSLQRASERLTDGQLIYGPIAALWDEYLQTDAVRKLPAKLRNPLKALCNDISITTQKHFDTFLAGAAPLSQTNSTIYNSTNPSIPSISTTPLLSAPEAPSPPNTYAEAVTTPPPTILQSTVRKPQERPARPARPAKPVQDTRLFIRLGPDHPARAAGSFAVLTVLKRQLRGDAYLLKEVQEIKTGFALCTESATALAALELHTNSMADAIADCKIEKQQNWMTYWMDYVPRTVQILDEHTQVQNTIVTDHILSEAVHDETGQQSIKIVQSSQSVNSGLFSMNWFVSFETSNHKTIPKVLRILGTTVTTHLLKYKPKTIQCVKCFQWHNARSCSCPQCCCTCGSNNHSTENHTTRCATMEPHTCPARCLHCGGPHSADDLKCPLRPSHKRTVTKAQRLIITQTSKLTRTKACAAAGCTRKQVTDMQMDEPTIISSPTTPIRQPLNRPPITASAPRFFTAELTNPVTPLSFNA